MTLFQYSLNKSYESLIFAIEDAIKYRQDRDKQLEVNYRLGTCLHWLIDYWERVEKHPKVTSENIELFSALRYANNRLKHDENLLVLTQITGGFHYPKHYPMAIPITEFHWKNASDIDPKHNNQKEHYIQLLQGKEVIRTIDEALKILDSLN